MTEAIYYRNFVNRYRSYCQDGISPQIDGIEEGSRPDVACVGLIRSLGGWAQVFSSRRSGRRVFSDERILRSSVTGASGGIGAWVARWLGKTGAGVVLLARSGDRLREVAADVADPQACRGAVETALERLGRLDGLVNNAALVCPLALTAQTDPAAWRRNIEVDLLGPFFIDYDDPRVAEPAAGLYGDAYPPSLEFLSDKD